MFAIKGELVFFVNKNKTIHKNTNFESALVELRQGKTKKTKQNKKQNKKQKQKKKTSLNKTKQHSLGTGNIFILILFFGQV